MKEVLFIDPGNTTGFAIFSSEDDCHWKKDKIGFRPEVEQVFDLLDMTHPDILVVEKFTLFPWKSMKLGWSQMTTSQIIGACHLYAYRRGIPFIQQSTDNRDIGYMNGQVPKLPKSNPANHAHDAWAHGCYWVIHTNRGVLV